MQCLHFFLVVKTNVNYQVVPTFSTKSESTESLAEALQVINQWILTYNLQYFIKDYSTEEIIVL